MFEKLKAEFPTFDVSTLPAIPGNWVDVSWHNDTCPSFEAIKNDGGAVYVFVDFPDSADREFPETKRYSIVSAPHMRDTETLLDTDDWAAVLAKVADIFA